MNQDFDADDGREDDDEEQPTVVVLKEGDLTEEEFKAEKEKNKGKINSTKPIINVVDKRLVCQSWKAKE